MHPYHFVRLEADGSAPFRARVAALGGSVCLDLEDSVDAPDVAYGQRLKAQRRREVVALVQHLGPDASGLFVRVNRAGTAEHARDVEALRTAEHLPGLFLPKVEHAADVSDLLAALGRPAPAVIPVVESEAGFAAVAGLRAAGGGAVREVAFGHCDYNLDRGLFPFAHPGDDRYWAWMERLGAACARGGLGVVNSPVLRLDDRAHFRAVQARLARIPNATGQVTLSLSQTQACAAAPQSLAAGKPAESPRAESLRAEAQRTARRFEAHRRADGFLAVDASRTLVSPQEYRAARAVLAQAVLAQAVLAQTP